MEEGFSVIQIYFDAHHNPTDYRYLEVNPAFEKLTGLSHVVGKLVTEILPNQEKDWLERYAKVALTGEPIHFESFNKSLNRYFYVHAFRISDPGSHQVAIIFNEITQRKRAEQELRELTKNLEKRVEERTHLLEEQAAKMKQLTMELTQAEQNERKKLAEILHDHLQQLLVAAKMRLTSLTHQQPGKEINEAHTFIDQAFEASRSLTAQLSPPALYEEGLVQALKLLAEKIEHQYKVKVNLNISNIAEPQEDSLKIIIYQCVQELLFNVIKYARVSSCSLTMKTSYNGNIEVIVKDQGVGFNTKDMEKKTSGGYGLFSIRERIKSLGGEFRIASALGEGTESEIIIPQKLVHAWDEDTGQRPFSLKSTILIVDDNEANILALDAVLKTEGYNLLHASSGVEALNLLKKFDADVILLDIQMPDLDGYEVAKLIKQMPHCKNTPIIFITAIYTTDPYIKKGYDVGAIDYFTKPFDTDILKQKVAIYSSFRQRDLLLKEREKRIKESEKLLRAGQKLAAVLESLAVGVVTVDSKGNIIQINDGVLKIWKCLGDNDKNPCVNFMKQWKSEGEQFRRLFLQVLETGQAAHNEITKIKCFDGSSRTVLSSVSPMTGHDGRIQGAVGVIQDITEQKKIGEDIEESVLKLISLSAEFGKVPGQI